MCCCRGIGLVFKVPIQIRSPRNILLTLMWRSREKLCACAARAPQRSLGRAHGPPGDPAGAATASPWQGRFIYSRVSGQSSRAESCKQVPLHCNATHPSNHPCRASRSIEILSPSRPPSPEYAIQSRARRRPIQTTGNLHAVRMATTGEATLPATRRTRKSIGGGTATTRNKTLDKENATLDVSSAVGATRKKSRSKSMGPGGLDTLKTGHGNRRAVGALGPWRRAAGF